MSPEQARGQKEIDGRTDLFSLGAVLFCAIVGRAPFEGRDAVTTLFKLATEPAPQVERLAPATPLRLAQLVNALLERDPRARPASATFVLAELERTRVEMGSEASIVAGVTLTAVSPVRGGVRPIFIVAGAVAVAALAAAGAALGVYLTRAPERPSTARATPSSPEPSEAPPPTLPPERGSSQPVPNAAGATTLAGWFDFRDPLGAVEGKFECQPVSKHIPKQIENSATTERSQVSCDSKLGFNSVSVSDVLAGASMGCDFANNTNESFVMQRIGCEIRSRSEVTMGVFSGTQLSVTCGKGKMEGEMRFVCDPKLLASGRGRAMVIQLLRLTGHWNPTEAAAFWQSIRLHTLP